MSRSDRPVGSSIDGYISERVNLSDWEGAGSVGGNIGGSNPWVESAVLGTCIEIPGLYIRSDEELVYPIDHIETEIVDSNLIAMKVQLTNSTIFDANVSVLAETQEQAKSPLGTIGVYDLPKVPIPAGQSVQITVLKDVNMKSFAVFANHWLQTDCDIYPYCEGSDLDALTTVDSNDLRILGLHWLQDMALIGPAPEPPIK